MGTFDDLIKQVDSFIRKYYKNLMIKGAFLFVIIFLSSLLLVLGLEYIGRFNSFVRAFLLFSFIGLNAYVLIKYFAVPLSQLFSFGKRINRYQAAQIIGTHFPTVNDRLLNTLQLQDVSQTNPKNIELLNASVQQNAQDFNKLSFSSAIDYRTNRIFLKYFIPIFLTVVLIGIVAPTFFTSGSERLVKYNQVFEASPNFTFEILNSSLLVEEGASVEVQVKMIPRPGKAIPNKIYLSSNEGDFLMDKPANNMATYQLENVNDDINFTFKSSNAVSKSYKIHVAKRTSLGQLQVQLSYPDYLKRKNETISNPGDVIIPEGTKLTWNGITKNTALLTVVSPDTTQQFTQAGFRFSQQFFSSSMFSFILKNKELDKSDTLSHSIEVIKDQYPQISLAEHSDSTQKNKVYFSGNVQDDHGLNRLEFTYTIKKKKGKDIHKTTPVPGVSGSNAPFSMTFNLNQLDLSLEDRVTYYFTVYDNDGVNGSKATKSRVYQYFTPSRDELQEQRSETKDKAVEELKNLMQETKDFQEKLSRLKKESTNSKKSTYQQKKQIQNLQKQQKSLQERMKKLNKELKSSFEEKSKLSPMDEKLKQKQKLLEEMMDEVMDDELKDLLDELEKLMEENNTKDLLEKMEESEMDAEEMERQMDRTMEMLKTMDVEERAKDLQKALEETAKKQDELKEETEKENASEKTKKKQEELNKEFDKIQKDLEKMLKKNKDLKRPMEFEDLKKKGDETKKEMNDAKQNLEDQKQKPAQENQKNASQKMQEMSSQIAAQMKKSQKKKKSEDIEALRALLENLIHLSFTQETLLSDFKSTSIQNPSFVSLGRDQRALIDNFSPVKDSLLALADRIPKVASFVEQELEKINKNTKYIPSHIGEREKRPLAVKQQFVMTSFNNLALFLNETLENAQKQMKGMQPGKGSCDKPGAKPGSGKKGGMKGMKEMLKQQLEQLKKGNNPGGTKPGSKPGQKPGGLLPINSKQAAKMAAEQGAMRRKLEEIREEMNKDGSGKGNQLNKLLQELEDQQKKLVNKEWSSELIERQEKILTRLLQSEKAIKERGFEKKRESNSGKNDDFSNQIEFLEYKNQKEKQIELLRTLDPAFSRYYKEKANAYFLNLNN